VICANLTFRRKGGRRGELPSQPNCSPEGRKEERDEGERERTSHLTGGGRERNKSCLRKEDFNRELRTFQCDPASGMKEGCFLKREEGGNLSSAEEEVIKKPRAPHACLHLLRRVGGGSDRIKYGLFLGKSDVIRKTPD